MSQLTLADCWPRRFSPSSLALQFCEDPTQAEQPLFAKASAGEAVAQLWQALQGLVVPGSYRQFTDLPAVSAHFAARGWPVWLRRTDLSFAVRCAAAHPRALRRCQPPPGGERFLLRWTV